MFTFQMMVEEVKKAKELVTMQPKVKGGDDEPDWQNVRNENVNILRTFFDRSSR